MAPDTPLWNRPAHRRLSHTLCLSVHVWLTDGVNMAAAAKQNVDTRTRFIAISPANFHLKWAKYRRHYCFGVRYRLVAEATIIGVLAPGYRTNTNRGWITYRDPSTGLWHCCEDAIRLLSRDRDEPTP